MCRINLSLS